MEFVSIRIGNRTKTVLRKLIASLIRARSGNLTKTVIRVVTLNISFPYRVYCACQFSILCQPSQYTDKNWNAVTDYVVLKKLFFYAGCNHCPVLDLNQLSWKHSIQLWSWIGSVNPANSVFFGKHHLSHHFLILLLNKISPVNLINSISTSSITILPVPISNNHTGPVLDCNYFSHQTDSVLVWISASVHPDQISNDHIDSVLD